MKEPVDSEVELVEVTPEIAAKWLALTRGNRNISRNWVQTLAARMHRKEFQVSEIAFDDKGQFVDGHHRLSAVVLFGHPVWFRVRRGLRKNELYLLDGARRRSVADQLLLYRPEVTNRNARVAATTMCAQLTVAGDKVQIGNLKEYDSWYAFYERGLNWAVDYLCSNKHSNSRHSAVCGSLAFAHIADPKEVEKFGQCLRDEAKHGRGDPSWALAQALKNKEFFQGGGSSGRYAPAYKVLSAVYAHLNGQQMLRVNYNREAVRFFSAAYSQAAVKRLLAEMFPFNSPRPSV